MFWWIFGFIAIALAIFLIYKRINSLTINKSKEPQLKPNVETAPQIDTGAITSNLPNLCPVKSCLTLFIVPISFYVLYHIRR